MPNKITKTLWLPTMLLRAEGDAVTVSVSKSSTFIAPLRKCGKVSKILFKRELLPQPAFANSVSKKVFISTSFVNIKMFGFSAKSPPQKAQLNYTRPLHTLQGEGDYFCGIMEKY